MSKSMARGRIRSMRGCRVSRLFITTFVVATVMVIGTARATWFDAAWKFRWPIEAIWDAEHGTGEQLCFATFYTAGHMKPSGPLSSTDIRVATDAGKPVPSPVIYITADRLRVVFASPTVAQNFFVCFGNDD